MSAAPDARRAARPLSLAAAASLCVAVALAVGFCVQRFGEDRAAQRAFPRVTGRIAVLGAESEVRVFRDAQGVPHVEAASEADAFFGLGFAHAQDRLGQMVWLRRAAQGRLAEVLGPVGLAADRLARLLDLAGLGAAQLERMDGPTRRLLEAYASGVNARIAGVRAGQVGPPLTTARHAVPLDDWSAADSLGVLKLYIWGMSSSHDVSLVLEALIEELGGFGARPFFPPGIPTDDGPRAPAAPRPREASGARGSRLAQRGELRLDPLRGVMGLEGHLAGSSAWVVGGDHTLSGRPLLAADAHFEPTAPAVFHVDHIRGGDLDVAGATLPGVPVFWTGRNPKLAWASTHARAVTSNLYKEVLDSPDGARYHDGRRWRDLASRVETIAVKGEDDDLFTVRSTRHGPLIEGLLGGDRALSVAWVGGRSDPKSAVRTLLGVARARSADAVVAALAKHAEPALAVVFADASGDGGLQVAGWIPRRSLSRGLVPLEGRARVYDWSGPVPFAALPRERLRSDGWLIAADNVFAHPERPEHIEWLWRTGERVRRIDSLLASATAAGPIGLRRLAGLQLDVGALRAGAIVEAALDLALEGGPLGPEAQEIAELLRGWDRRETATSAGAAAYHLFLESLTEQLFEPQIGAELLGRYLALPQTSPGYLVHEALRAAARRSTGSEGEGESETEVVRTAVRSSLRETWLTLSYRLGSNRAKWRWGRLHTLRFRPMRPLAATGLLGRGLGPFPFGGSGSTVNAADYSPTGAFDVRIASTFRFAVDTGALAEVLISLAPGQSEHPKHPHYRDGLERWLEGRPTLMATGRMVVEETSATELVLEPR